MSQKCGRTVEVTEECNGHVTTPTQLVEICMDWQDETIRAIYFLTGEMMTKDTAASVHLCEQALKSLGHPASLAMDISHLLLTKEEEVRYKELFRTIVERLYEEKYVCPHIIMP